MKNISLNKVAAMTMIVMYSIFLILLICMDWYLIGNYQREKREEEKQQLSGYVEQVSEDLEEISATLYDIYANNRYFEALGGVLTDAQEYGNIYELDNGLRSKIILREYLHGYIVYYGGKRNVRYYMDQTKIEVDDIQELKALSKDLIENDAGNWHWYFLNVGANRYGMIIGGRANISLCMIYNLDWVEKYLETDDGTGKELFFVNGEEMLGSPEKEIIDENVLEALYTHEKDFLCYSHGKYVYGQRVVNTDLWICMEVPVTIFSYLNMPQLFLLLLTFLSIFVAFLIYHYMQKELIFPLRKLIDMMNRIRDGEWDASFRVEAKFEEVQKVNEAFEVMISEIRKQKMLSYEQTIEKQRAQMQYLQLQLKPHFYLNGLKTLNVLALNGDIDRMQDIIMHLSYHLRYLLQAEKELVLLKDEISYVKNYEKLQKDMADRRFMVEWQIQEKLKNWSVPNLCIQTFVENSFKYARLGSMQRELVILISLNELETEKGRFLDICIKDNGAGYPEPVLREINEEPTEGNMSVGINNLKRRCNLLYGELVEYSFYNEDGALSEMILPWIKSSEE